MRIFIKVTCEDGSKERISIRDIRRYSGDPQSGGAVIELLNGDVFRVLTSMEDIDNQVANQ